MRTARNRMAVLLRCTEKILMLHASANTSFVTDMTDQPTGSLRTALAPEELGCVWIALASVKDVKRLAKQRLIRRRGIEQRQA